MLNTKTVTYFEVEEREFERFVKEIYGHDYSFVADVECGNDSEHSFPVRKSEIDEWDAARLETFKQTGRYDWLVHTLFQDLVNRDLIPEGNYLVSVSW
jgi:hypothetical protein